MHIALGKRLQGLRGEIFKMDDIDFKLLDVIQQNGRGGLAQFGETVGLSKTAVHERLKKLTASGVIKGWTALVDPIQAGYPVVLLIRAEVDLPSNRLAFADSVSQLPGVQECHMTSGRWNCYLKLRAASIEQAERLIDENIASIKGVVSIQVDTVTDTKKETLFLPGIVPTR
jgi:Lrp/AsnC family leucine-responsive transcriptional regulator